MPTSSTSSFLSGEGSPPKPRALTEMLVLAFAISLTLLLHGTMVALLMDRESWMMKALGRGIPKPANKDEDW